MQLPKSIKLKRIVNTQKSDRDVNYEWRKNIWKANKINSVSKNRVPHMQVDLYLISEIFCASLFLSFLCARECWEALKMIEKVCHTHTAALLWNYEKLRLLKTQFFCWNKKFRLIDDSKAQFENDVAENYTKQIFFSWLRLELQVRICPRSTLKNEVCLFQLQGSFDCLFSIFRLYSHMLSHKKEKRPESL